MNVKDYTIKQLMDGVEEYRKRLAVSLQGDKRRVQTKLDITFDKAMLTLFETELARR